MWHSKHFLGGQAMADITDVIVNVGNRNIPLYSSSTVATDGVNFHIRQVKPETNHCWRSVAEVCVEGLTNLKEKAENASIRYQLQKQMWVFFWLTWSQLSCTFSVKHARVHLHGRVTRCAVLLRSPPFIRCLTSFCQTALPQLFFLWLNGHFIAEIMQCRSGALLEHQNTEM